MTMYQSGVGSPEDIEIQVGCAVFCGRSVGYQDICLAGEVGQRPAAPLGTQVECQAFLIAIENVECGARSSVVCGPI